MTCHEPAGAPQARTLDVPTVLLVGNPNVGKSTLFNLLTGARQHVMNAPGTTVELRRGTWSADDRPVRLTDLPGTYSLLARSPDEEVTAAAVADRGPDRADVVVVLVDASALPRSLYLLAQVAEQRVPVVVAVTMNDVAARAGAPVPADALAETLGVPVVAIDPRRGRGGDALAREVRRVLDGAATDGPSAAPSTRATSLAALVARTAPEHAEPRRPVSLEAELAHADVLFAWVDEVQRAVVDVPETARPSVTDRVDRWLLQPWVGLPVLLVVMWLAFQVATSVAAPLMDLVDRAVGGWFAGLLADVMPGPAWLEGLVVDGLVAGLGTVLSFAPLMGMMFVGVALLEDSGYLARAAFVADRAMRAIGLDGRAVLPLVVGFGCNLSALAATRTLPDARQRTLTAFLVPYTSCAARLTVYVLLAGAFFPDHAGTVVLAMYVVSVLMVVVVGLVLRRTVFRDLGREPLVIALPAYQRPRLRALLLSAGKRVEAFVRKAGTIIVLTLTVVWLLQAVPVTGSHQVADVPVGDSAYGWAAQAAAPVFGPAGFGDWHATAALATGFVAKEVVVGAFAQSFAVDEPQDPADGGSLAERLRASFDESSGGHGGVAAIAFLVFVLTYTPCLATVAEQARLLGARRTAVAVAIQLVTAWLLAVAVFQVGRLWW